MRREEVRWDRYIICAHEIRSSQRGNVEEVYKLPLCSTRVIRSLALGSTQRLIHPLNARATPIRCATIHLSLARFCSGRGMTIRAAKRKRGSVGGRRVAILFERSGMTFPRIISQTRCRRRLFTPPSAVRQICAWK